MKAGLADRLRLARLLYEKCEMTEAKRIFTEARELATAREHREAKLEAMAGLLRLAAEALDTAEVESIDRSLDEEISSSKTQPLPAILYSKGAIARRKRQFATAQRYFHRYVRSMSSGAPVSSYGQTPDEMMAKGWLMLMVVLQDRGHNERSLKVGECIEKWVGTRPGLDSVRGILAMNRGKIQMQRKDWIQARRFYDQAFAHFTAAHDWYYVLHVLLEYARIARNQGDFVLAYSYLDIVERSSADRGMAALKQSVLVEKQRLQSDAVDVVIDGDRGTVRTREKQEISLGKQYVLLNILQELSRAHSDPRSLEGGLSKAEIIERVWKEPYRPAAHDNKLYYNINRLRKLIEPDVSRPQYLLNWREGYRLAPGLKVQLHGVRMDSEHRGGK